MQRPPMTKLTRPMSTKDLKPDTIRCLQSRSNPTDQSVGRSESTRPTASRQPAYRSSEAALLISGSKCRSKAQVLEKPSTPGYRPTCIPANQSAPRAVVSMTSGRSTGACKISDYDCTIQSLATIPPSTRNTASPDASPAACSQSERIASYRSRV